MYRRATSHLSRAKLNLKWYSDKIYLPLTSSHINLYKKVHNSYKNTFNSFPDIIRCPDYNSSIQWLKLFDQNPLIIQCSDKLAVRDYVRKMIGDKYLTKIYCVEEIFSRVDLLKLPDSFVIKCNHDSGTVRIIRNKHETDFSECRTHFDASLSRTYGVDAGEWAYSHVKPRLLVEQYIGPDDRCPPDYKFHCVDGHVRFVQYIYDRETAPREILLEPNGSKIFGLNFDTLIFKPGTGPVDMQNWQEMISIANTLSQEFKYVRVDLFSHEERIYFGEMTFWPMAGLYRSDAQKTVGRYMDFDRTTFKTPIH